jgi:hypothetical protein
LSRPPNPCVSVVFLSAKAEILRESGKICRFCNMKRRFPRFRTQCVMMMATLRRELEQAAPGNGGDAAGKKGDQALALGEPLRGRTLNQENSGMGLAPCAAPDDYARKEVEDPVYAQTGKRNSLGIPESFPIRNDGSRMQRETSQGKIPTRTEGRRRAFLSRPYFNRSTCQR